MKNLCKIAAMLMGLFSGAVFAADSTVPAMTAAGAITSSDLFYCVQGSGTQDRKCSATQIQTFNNAFPMTVNGTVNSGGIPYFSSATAMTSSAVLTANALMIGGGAGVAPSTTTTGTDVVTALGVNVGSAGAFVVNGGALGTPSSGTLTNATGLPIGSGVTGLGTGVATFLATPSSANLATAVTDETGSGALVFATSPTLVTPALGTPSSVTLTNATGLPIGGISGLGTGVGTFLATPSSANLASALTDETGSGSAVFATSPTLVTPVLGAATATSVNKVALTAPATGSTLTIADGKTLVASNSLTLAGTDATVMTFPGVSATIPGVGVANTFSAAQTFTSAAPQLTLGVNATTLGSIKFFGNTSGDLTLSPAAVAGTTSVVTLPGRSGTVAYTSGTLTSGNCAKFDASGNIVDNGSACSSGGGSPGGADTQVQFNDGGAFGGDAGLVYNKTSNALTIVSGSVTSGNIELSSNVVWLQAFNSAARADSDAYVARQTGGFGWDSSNSTAAGVDTALHRSAAGIIAVDNGSAGTYRDILARGLRSNAVTFANAIASPVEGTLQAFTDSTTATWGATITGGGSNHVLGYYNGTNWTVAAK